MTCPKKYSTVFMAHGIGRVVETFISGFIVRIYDVGDFTVYLCDEWRLVH